MEVVICGGSAPMLRHVVVLFQTFDLYQSEDAQTGKAG